MAEFIKKANGIAVRFYVEKNGKRERIYLYEKGWTQEDAENAMVDYRQRMGFIDDKEINVAGFLNKFYEDYVEKSVTETTQRRYDEFIGIHIVPEIGNVRLQKLKPAEIQALYTRLIKKGLSNSTVLKIHRFLHLAFRYAVLWGYLKFNPADGVKAPSVPKKEMVIPTDEEIKIILNYAKGKDIYWPIYIASTTGMRLGEVCGLQESSVDFNGKKYIIQHTLKRVNGKLTLKSTKTAGSRRPVPFLPGTNEELKKYLKNKTKNKLKHGPKYVDSGFFLQRAYGQPMQPDDVSKAFKAIVRKLGLNEVITFHSLRHYHASWLLRQGVHPRIVQERLGHSSVKITLDTYSHLLPDMQRVILEKLDCSVFEAK
ncbi:MAG TPA: site-specific integrase [Peptococcaceae bacterium]|nr:site-specific integrase [Peptococcaceae bacterium]